MQAKIKTKNSKKLQIEALVDSGCTHIEIDEQLVKDKRIQTRLINFLFGVYNTNKIKNGNITKVVLLKVKINRHKEYIEAAIMDLNRIDMLKLRTMDLASILFYFILFYFTFIFSYLVENKMKKTKCDTVTGHMILSQRSHDHMIQRKV